MSAVFSSTSQGSCLTGVLKKTWGRLKWPGRGWFLVTSHWPILPCWKLHITCTVSTSHRIHELTTGGMLHEWLTRKGHPWNLGTDHFIFRGLVDISKKNKVFPIILVKLIILQTLEKKPSATKITFSQGVFVFLKNNKAHSFNTHTLWLKIGSSWIIVCVAKIYTVTYQLFKNVTSNLVLTIRLKMKCYVKSHCWYG